MRYKVIHLATEHYHYGWTAEELLRQHPDLNPEEVYAALTFFYDHHEQMVTEMRGVVAESDTFRSSAGLSRSELLARRKQHKDDGESS